jgi:hypothetical protein
MYTHAHAKQVYIREIIFLVFFFDWWCRKEKKKKGVWLIEIASTNKMVTTQKE